MDYEHPFVQEVRNHPQDDAPRLIFADYLEEAGDPQAELIRVQVALSHLTPGDPARRELELREDELLTEYADAWLEPLRERGAEGVSRRCFQRGLIERVRISVENVWKYGAELCRIAPALHCLEIRGAAGRLDRLAVAYIAEQITELDFRCNRFTASDFSAFQRAYWRERLTGLSLAFCSLDEVTVNTMLHDPWPRLERLDLSVNCLEPNAYGLMQSRKGLPRLKKLSASVNRTGDLGLAQLGNCYLAGTLRELDVGTTHITGAGILAFAASPLMAGLETLILRGNVLGASGPEAIAALANAPNLKRLDLRGTHCGTSRYGYGSVTDGPPEALRERLGENLLW